MKITIQKEITGHYTIKINGKYLLNERSCPKGVATFESEEEAQNYLNNK